MLMAKKAPFTTGQVSWEMTRKYCCITFQRKCKFFLRPETVDKVIKIWVDFAALYKNLSDWQPHTSPTKFWLKAKQRVNDFVSLTGLREGYQRKRVTPYMHIMVAHIPWVFQMYKVVKLFKGQGVERNNDVARSTVLRKSHKWDSVGDVLHQESCQWQLRSREWEPQSYRKHKTEYWEDIFKIKRSLRSSWMNSPIPSLLCLYGKTSLGELLV